MNAVKAGGIYLEEGKKGKVKFYAFNHQRGKRLHIGTLSGVTYEKVAVILRQPEPSFALTQSEFGAVIESGAGFIRIIPPDKSGTYSISVKDFERHKAPYFNSGYGGQWRVSLPHFAYSAAVTKRNSRTDNPVIAVQRDIIQPRQMGMFG
jgi:hypothetical protein